MQMLFDEKVSEVIKRGKYQAIAHIYDPNFTKFVAEGGYFSTRQAWGGDYVTIARRK